MLASEAVHRLASASAIFFVFIQQATATSSASLLRPRRQTDTSTDDNSTADNSTADNSTKASADTAARQHLDGHISSLLADLPARITKAKNRIEFENQKNYIIRHTQGWAIVFASFNDAFSAMALQNKSFAQTTPVDLYRTGFTLNYGIGFGYPLLLALPHRFIYCDEYDFIRALERYGLQSGVSGAEAVEAAGLPAQYGASANARPAVLSSRVSEFDLVVRSNLDCVLSHEDTFIEVNEVSWALDQLITAMNLRMQLAAS